MRIMASGPKAFTALLPLAAAWLTAHAAPQIVPLFDASTKLEPALREETSDALITRLADRARDRHARDAVIAEQCRTDREHAAVELP